MDVGLPKSWVPRNATPKDSGVMKWAMGFHKESLELFEEAIAWEFWAPEIIEVKEGNGRRKIPRWITSDIFCVFYFLSTSGRHHFWGESSGHDWLPNKDMVQSRCGGQTYPQVHWILSWSSCSGVNVWNLKSTRKKWSIWVVKSRTAGDFLDIFWYMFI